MIVFDLRCATGHVFEAWFGSSDDFDAQQARNLVSCPICGSGEIGKAMMAPRIAAKGNQADVSASPVQMKAMMQALAKAQAKALEGSDYVGASFANEARAMHVGEIDHRAIHGQATPTEAKALIDEGVTIAALPLPVRPEKTDH